MEIVLLIILCVMIIWAYFFRKGKDNDDLFKKEEKVLKKIEEIKIQKMIEEKKRESTKTKDTIILESKNTQYSNDRNNQLDETREDMKKGVNTKEIEDEVDTIENRLEKMAREMTFLESKNTQHSNDGNNQLDEDILNEVKELMSRGQLIPAIKLYKDATGVGLKEASEFVKSLTIDIDKNKKQLDNDKINQLDETVLNEIKEWLRKGQKISAIKAYKKATGAGLKEAKEFVESL